MAHTFHFLTTHFPSFSVTFHLKSGVVPSAFLTFHVLQSHAGDGQKNAYFSML